ncbi:hypothetical protein [Microvirga alba]|uniref:Uncharacterized protein n=1 Tax=Microvirga alba TaxID=2791025 RepID=A0A931BUF3_9HYPH|nr:hypothetical protein [Microvirga alba]MBF9234918.1 hypothetical protein [Microvirga alba]
MRYLSVFILASIVFAAASFPAFAHRPYFTHVEKILLPNGELGEVRLLSGDGIFGPDPVRALILDAQGRLLARSPKSVVMALSCQAGGGCLIVDLRTNQVLELEPSSFRQGPAVPGLSSEDRDGLWDLEGGSESWGFSLREATAQERAEANDAMARGMKGSLLIIAGLGFVGALFLVPYGRRGEGRSAQVRAILGVVRFTLGFVAFGFFAAISLWLIVIAGVSLDLGFFALASGATTGLAVAALVKVLSAKHNGRRVHQAR